MGGVRSSLGRGPHLHTARQMTGHGVGGESLVRRATQLLVRVVPPRNRGMRLVRLVNKVLPPSERLYRTTYSHGITITCDLRDAVQSSIFYRGRHEEQITRLLLDELRPGDSFLDLGANIGYFTLLASRAVGPRGSVHAFEPSPLLCRRLSEDVGRNPFATNVTVHQTAVSDRSGTSWLSFPEDASSPYGEQHLEAGREARSSSVPVDVVTIDSELPDLRFDVVKVDVEGAEMRALAGMRGSIENHRPRLILVEAADQLLARFGDSATDLGRYLDGLGYEVERAGDSYDAPMLACRPRKSP